MILTLQIIALFHILLSFQNNIAVLVSNVVHQDSINIEWPDALFAVSATFLFLYGLPTI